MSKELEEIDAAIAEHEEKIEELKLRRSDIERPTSFLTTWYVHNNYNHSEMIELMGLDWELYQDTDYTLKHALNEMAVDVDINLRTGEYKILEVRCDGQVLTPAGDS